MAGMKASESVAPHAGAWIETLYMIQEKLKNGVAPHAGAWIETICLEMAWAEIKSLPMRERGLKLIYYRLY